MLEDRAWQVKATMPKPGPAGEATGELCLFLVEDQS
jgi:hypothetical protein